MRSSPLPSIHHILSSDRWRWWRMVRQDNSTISKHLAWDSSLQMLEHVRTAKQDVAVWYALKCRRAVVLLGNYPSSWNWDSITQLTLLQAATAPSYFPEWRFFLPGRAGIRNMFTCSAIRNTASTCVLFTCLSISISIPIPIFVSMSQFSCFPSGRTIG